MRQARSDACVGEEDVQSAVEEFLGLLGQGVEGVQLAHVSDEAMGVLVVEGLDRSLEAIRILTSDEDLGAMGQEELGCGEADPCGAASDDSGLAFQALGLGCCDLGWWWPWFWLVGWFVSCVGWVRLSRDSTLFEGGLSASREPICQPASGIV